MSKILRNDTLSAITISDTGVTIDPGAGNAYTIPAVDYLLWAESSNIITEVGAGNIVVNDGSNDLSISDGIDLIKGLFPKSIKITDGTDEVDIIDDAGIKRLAVDTSVSIGDTKIKGDTDDTLIGNVGDSLKTNVTASALPTGAATEAKQDTGNTSLGSIDTKLTDGTQQTKIKGDTDGTLIGNTGDSLHTKVTATVLPPGAATEAKQDSQITEAQSTNTKLDTLNAKDFATSAKQDTGNTSLAAIDTQMTDGTQVTKIRGATDGTEIGNIGDRLKTDTLITNPDPIPVDGDLKTTAFGELSTLAIDPYIALIPVTGLKPREVETFTSGTGSAADVVDNNPGKEFRVSSGTSVGGYGVIRSRKTLLYRPGIGSLGRFTTRFGTPTANGIQRAGFFNIGNELTVGYNGTQFGILRKTGGRPEIRKLTITTASNQSTNVTVTLDGTAHVVPVTNVSAAENAYEIASFSFSGWNVYNIGNAVIFQSEQTANQNGTYSATPAAGNFAGTFSQVLQGDAGTENWTYQSSWSETSLSTGSDPFILDPSKGNVFQIQFQYLGYGQITFSVENPNTGEFIPFHIVSYTNANVTPSLDLPNMKMGIIAANSTNTTSVSVFSACISGFNENDSPFPLNVNAAANDVKGLSTTLENILAVRKNTINGLEILDVNDVQLEDLTVAADATKPVFFDILLNPDFAYPVEWEQSQGVSPISFTGTGGEVTNGTLIYSIAVSKSSNLRINLKDLDVILSNDDVVCIAARTTAGSADVAAAVVWGSK